MLRESLLTSSNGFFYLTQKQFNGLNGNLPNYFPSELKNKNFDEIYVSKNKKKKIYSLKFDAHLMIRDTKEYENEETKFAFKNLMMLNLFQIFINNNYSDYLHKTHHLPTFIYYHGALKKISNESVESKHSLTRKIQCDSTQKGSKAKNKIFLDSFNPKFLRSESIMEINYSQIVLRSVCFIFISILSFIFFLNHLGLILFWINY